MTSRDKEGKYKMNVSSFFYLQRLAGLLKETAHDNLPLRALLIHNIVAVGTCTLCYLSSNA